MVGGEIYMNLTQEQMIYIKEHLRDADKTYAVCALAKKIAETNSDMALDHEEVSVASLVMNIGETNEKMMVNGVSIYSKEYGPWDDIAKTLNAERGSLSAEMATEQGIELSDSAKDAIIASSKGGSLNKMGIALKVAQTMEAIKHTRWSRGEQKESVQNIDEMTEIVGEELDFMLSKQDIDKQTKNQIKESMLSSAREVYVSEKQHSIKSKIIHVNWDEGKMMQEMGIEYIIPSIMEPERVEQLLKNVPAERIDELHNEVDQITSQQDSTSMYEVEKSVVKLLGKWEKEYIERNEKDDIED